MLGSHFVKMNVYGSGMQIVGKAKDLIIDPETCSLTDLVLELNKDVAKQVLGSRLVVGRKKVSVARALREFLCELEGCNTGMLTY